MTTETKIIGAEFDANCDCCARKLKVGIKLSGLGMTGRTQQVQALYILNNLQYWRHPDAKAVRATLKEIGKSAR